MLATEHLPPFLQAFLQHGQRALVLAIQMQRISHGAAYEKSFGVTNPEQSPPLLQTFFVDAQRATVLAPAAEQRRERQLRRLREGQQRNLAGVVTRFMLIIERLFLFLRVVDSVAPLLGQTSCLRLRLV